MLHKSRMATYAGTSSSASRLAAGQAMFALNQRALSKNYDRRLDRVKHCVNQAVLAVFPDGHATVQLQGSTAKGTGIRDHSDWDFLVRLTTAIDTVTKNQRMQVRDVLKDNLDAAGIYYDIRVAEKRLQLRHGSCNGAPLPGADVVFESFKGRRQVLPKSGILAASSAGQSVSRFLKVMPYRYTHLPREVKRVEELVQAVENHMRCQLGYKKKDILGKTGFDSLLTATLKVLDGSSNMHSLKAVQTAVQNAHMDSTVWREAAHHALNQRAAGHPWPMAGM